MSLKKFKPTVYPYPPGCDQNARCGFHDGSPGHTTENYRSFKFKVKELINNKLLTLKENGPNIDILITRSDNDEIKGFLKPLETSTCQKGVGTLVTSVNDVSEVNRSTHNDQMFASEQCKEKVDEMILESSSGKDLPHPNKGHDPTRCYERKKSLGSLFC